jgi:hypothetical protein
MQELPFFGASPGRQSSAEIKISLRTVGKRQVLSLVAQVVIDKY